MGKGSFEKTIRGSRGTRHDRLGREKIVVSGTDGSVRRHPSPAYPGYRKQARLPQSGAFLFALGTFAGKCSQPIFAAEAFSKQISEQLQGFQPEIALILGSGLGRIANLIKTPHIVKYADIKGFPQSSVAGHSGRFVAGMLNGKKILCMQGRIHLYEGCQLC